jgi:hypothetical protein
MKIALPDINGTGEINNQIHIVFNKKSYPSSFHP